jgi:uncharacterized membrane protein
MRRIHFLLFVLVVTLAVLLTLAFISWYFSVTSPTSYMDSWMNQMWGGSSNGNYGGMGGMMGGGTGTSTVSTSYLWVIPLILGAAVAVTIAGVAFYSVFPELKYIKTKTTCNPSVTDASVKTTPAGSATDTKTAQVIGENLPTVSNNCDVLLRTLTPEEKKVVNVLVAHQGKYLQKYVVKETGLSRLKTHRIIARFAERGIVNVEEFGNTNQIVLANWIKS